MKRSKIAIAVGSLVLAIGAFITTKANRNKPFTANDIYANGVGYIATNVAGHPHLTLTASSGHTAFLVTGTSSTKRTLMTAASSTHKWYKF